MTVHRTYPPTRAMRETPDIDQLKRQAKELLEAYRAQSPDAVIEVSAYHRTATPETFALHDAQFVLARAHRQLTQQLFRRRWSGSVLDAPEATRRRQQVWRKCSAVATSQQPVLAEERGRRGSLRPSSE